MAASAKGPLEIGSVFHGRYEIRACISAGGMGAVYEVIHIETQRRRALKVMLAELVADPGLRARFKLEAQVTAKVRSAHIVETFDAGFDAETELPFLVMELLEGEDLGHVLDKRGALAPADVVSHLGQAARALDKTHAAGIVHRDLKPENLFLAVREDEPVCLKILDFGIAKVVAESTKGSKTTHAVGTPLYMAPEQIEGTDIGRWTDLYSLGHIAFALLVGAPYFIEEARRGGNAWPVMMQVMRGVREPASERAARLGAPLPAAFDAWFAKATALAPKDRFEQASECVRALAEALGNPSAEAAPDDARGSGPRLGSRVPDPGDLALVDTEASTPNQRGGTMSAITRPVVASGALRLPIAFALVALGVGLGGFLLLRRGEDAGPSASVMPGSAAPAGSVAAAPPAASAAEPAPREPPPASSGAVAVTPASDDVTSASVASSPSVEPTAHPTPRADRRATTNVSPVAPTSRATTTAASRPAKGNLLGEY